MFETRLVRVFAAFAGALSVLALRAFALQSVEKDLILKAQDARIHRRFILTPRRGDILWADGSPAATDGPGFVIQIDPVDFEATRWKCGACGAVFAPKSAPKTCPCCGSKNAPVPQPPPDLADLARTLGLTDEELAERFDKITLAHETHPEIGTYALVDRVDPPTALAASLAWDRFPGVTVRAIPIRTVDPVAAAIVGRTRPAYRSELEARRDPTRADRGERVYSAAEVYAMRFGSHGLEARFDDLLRGDPGRAFRPSSKDRGAVGPTLEQPVVDGVPLRTTLRRDVQSAADEMVRGAPGDASAVVLDVGTGAVVAIASRSKDALNHAVCGIRPGSVFKLVTALALLEAGISPQETVVCEHRGKLPSGRRYVCDDSHGALDLRDAFAHSCNAYFETMAERIGSDAMLAACRELGLDVNPNLHLAGTRAGVRPTFGRSGKLGPTDMRFLSIGQGRALVSPLQIAVAYGRVASGGLRIAPYLVDVEAPPAPDVEPSLARFGPILREGARRVVTCGTGSDVRELVAIDAAGKSGTADMSTAASLNNAWFVAYAPYENPRYVAVVVFENVARHGAAMAGPCAGRLLAEALR